MNTQDWKDHDAPDKTITGFDDLQLGNSDVEDLLAINWQLVLRIEQTYEEQRELTRQFDRELDELFALIPSPESASDESSDPPGWPNL